MLFGVSILIFGIVLAVMMIRRPEGLFPVETAKAEMHGIGISDEVSAATAAEQAVGEELIVEEVLASEGSGTDVPDPETEPPDEPGSPEARS